MAGGNVQPSSQLGDAFPHTQQAQSETVTRRYAATLVESELGI